MKFKPEWIVMGAFVIALILVMGFASAVFAAPVIITANDLRKGGLEVTGFIVDIAPKTCSNPVYDQNDLNNDGTLDVVCVGLTYSPCIPGSVDAAYVQWQQQGKVCEDGCDGLIVSPRPSWCDS
jgi:hypothetical protein